MTTTDPGVARALDEVERRAEALLRAVADARQALQEGGRSEALNATMDEAATTLASVPPLVGDPMHTPAEIARLVDMADDGRWPWVRFIPSSRWRQIVAFAEPDPAHGRREWALYYLAPDGVQVELVDPATTLPAYTADGFDRACDERERLAEVRDLQQQRALDFGHDHGPAVA